MEPAEKGVVEPRRRRRSISSSLYSGRWAAMRAFLYNQRRKRRKKATVYCVVDEIDISVGIPGVWMPFVRHSTGLGVLIITFAMFDRKMRPRNGGMGGWYSGRKPSLRVFMVQNRMNNKKYDAARYQIQIESVASHIIHIHIIHTCEHFS